MLLQTLGFDLAQLYIVGIWGVNQQMEEISLPISQFLLVVPLRSLKVSKETLKKIIRPCTRLTYPGLIPVSGFWLCRLWKIGVKAQINGFLKPRGKPRLISWLPVWDLLSPACSGQVGRKLIYGYMRDFFLFSVSLSQCLSPFLPPFLSLHIFYKNLFSNFAFLCTFS